MAKIIDDGAYYEDDEHKDTKDLLEQQPIEKKSKLIPFACIALFIIALVARLYFLLIASNPDNPGAGWFGDSYHHWQIGYLTKEIGFSQGFLRVWDLKGMDLFWGLLHPLVLAFAFMLTGNDSMALARAITCIAGAFSVVLMFLLGIKYWNWKVGLSAALMTALCSIIIFNDATGMVEPLGIPFLLAGVYFWNKKALLAGLMLGIAMLTRSEYWIYSGGLIVAFTLFDRKVSTDKKVLLWLGFAIVLIPYMKYLLDYTANPIYPFYQNFFKNIAGEWQFKKVLDAADITGQFTFRIILAITLFFTSVVLLKRPKGWQFHLLGLGNWLFLGLTFGVSNYIKSWADYVWVVRFMLFPYTYLIMVIAVALFYTLPSILKFLKNPVFTSISFVGVAGMIAISQLAWTEIYKYYEPTNATWKSVQEITVELIKPYQKNGKILIAEGNPDVTYALVHFHNIKGNDLVSQMYDPYFYYEEKELYPYANWNAVNPENPDGLTFRQEVLEWFKKNDIHYIITYHNRDRYLKLFELEPQIFTPVPDGMLKGFLLYNVDPDKI
jgi:hypothetical protein